MHVRRDGDAGCRQTAHPAPLTHQWEHAAETVARPGGDHGDFSLPTKSLEISKHPFRTIEDLAVRRFFRETLPIGGQLLNQLGAPGLYAHGKLLYRSFYLSNCLHADALHGMYQTCPLSAALLMS